ncbi:hypothetical protein N7463_001779 [Penicillium fimorum]|uniref:Uncharacterized protein n=1 Tax=Penicillium fimorum TaxID=1882269 RepID=A0A9W9XXZ6_9EURO|nr:hypothetical protein N7463_001779 [Penicillium fimorum]
MGATWCSIHCTAFLVTVYERNVRPPTLSLTSANPNIQPPDQRDYEGGSSSTAINELTNIPGGLDATTNPSAENGVTECPVGTDAKYKVENIASLANMPAGQYVLDLIDWTRDTMRLNKVSLPIEADMLKIHMFHDLRELAESVDQNAVIHSKSSCQVLDELQPFQRLYHKYDRDKTLEATASVVNAVYFLAISRHEGQDSQPPHFSDVFEEIYPQYPDDEYLTSLVNCVFGHVRNVILADKEEYNKAWLAKRKLVYPPVNEDDSYDHYDLVISDREF